MSSRILYLVKAPVPASIEEEKKGLYPPLGLLYLSSIAKAHGFQVKVFDLDVMPTDRLIEEFLRDKPLIVGFTTVTPSYNMTVKLIKLLKELNPNVITVVGGPHITLVPEDFKGIADVIVVGEGENALGKVLDDVERLRNQNNKSILIEGGIVDDLDSLPLPDRDVIDLSVFGENAGAIMTSRGCPYNCLFCVVRFIMGRRFRYRSPDNVLREWRLLKFKYKVPKVKIIDDVFTFDRDRALKIINEVKEEGLGPWSLPNGIRIDNVDLKLLEAMAESECTTIWYGIESGDQKVVNILRKGIRLEQAEQVIRWTKNVGIRVGLFFMVGAPGETLSSVYKTIEFIERVEPDYVHFSIATPYPNTDFWRWVEEHGRFLTRDYSHFEREFIFETPEYPLKDRLKAIEIIEKELGGKYMIEF